ncbi:hypothetical protein [Sphingomonas solaris]|uniref:hypothetical protein n=1 Tax=Alterirhizorhabdus solaris TaxID=2529389 RepID=UPI00139685FE|nr:hypothetical protein [Sphingomonas solaris]
MNNGTNDFGVSFAQISFLNRLLTAHSNVIEVRRSNDIQFDIVRERGGPIRLVCLDEYACGLARVFETQAAFPNVNLIYVGGVWNSYTKDAKQYCEAEQIGLFNAKEITGSLCRSDFWRYVRAD